MRQTEDGIEVPEINIAKLRERIQAIRSIYTEVDATLDVVEEWVTDPSTGSVERDLRDDRIREASESFILSSSTFESRVRELTNLLGSSMPYPGLARLRRP
jgi:hypothetical protein